MGRFYKGTGRWLTRKAKFNKLIKKGLSREDAKAVTKKKVPFTIVKINGVPKPVILPKDPNQKHPPPPTFLIKHKHRLHKMQHKLITTENIHVTSMKKGIVMIIMHVDYPNVNLTSSELDGVQDIILEKIENAGKDTGFKPKFSNIHYGDGYIIITCSNRATAEWLKCINGQLESIVLKEDMQEHKRHKLVGCFPSSGHYPQQKILELIDTQNEGIYSSSWIITATDNLENGALQLTFSVDSECLEHLKQMNFRLNYKFNQVELACGGPASGKHKKMSSIETPISLKNDSVGETSHIRLSIRRSPQMSTGSPPSRVLSPGQTDPILRQLDQSPVWGAPSFSMIDPSPSQRAPISRRMSPSRASNSSRRDSPRRSAASRRRRAPSPRRRAPSPRRRAPSPRRRAPSPRRRAPSPRRRAPSPRRRAPSPRRRAPSPRRRAHSPRRKAPSPRRRASSRRRTIGGHKYVRSPDPFEMSRYIDSNRRTDEIHDMAGTSKFYEGRSRSPGPSMKWMY